MVKAYALQLEKDDREEVLVEEDKDAGYVAGVVVQVPGYQTLTGPHALHTTQYREDVRLAP